MFQVVRRNVWTDLYDRDIERLTDERDEARAEVERLREALRETEEARDRWRAEAERYAS